MPEIQVPIELHQIRNPYLCVWMMGKTERILEVSNYARFAADPYVSSHHHNWLKDKFLDYKAKNTEKHVYKEDTEFIVTKNDLDDKGEFKDSKDKIFKEGEIATYYIGDSLPGSFPLWLKLDTEGESTKFEGEYEFDLTGLPYPMSIVEVNINRGNGWEELDRRGMVVDAFRSFSNLAIRKEEGWYEGKVSIPKGVSDKALVRIFYHRRLV